MRQESRLGHDALHRRAELAQSRLGELRPRTESFRQTRVRCLQELERALARARERRGELRCAGSRAPPPAARRRSCRLEGHGRRSRRRADCPGASSARPRARPSHTQSVSRSGPVHLRQRPKRERVLQVPRTLGPEPASVEELADARDRRGEARVRTSDAERGIDDAEVRRERLEVEGARDVERIGERQAVGDGQGSQTRSRTRCCP